MPSLAGAPAHDDKLHGQMRSSWTSAWRLLSPQLGAMCRTCADADATMQSDRLSGNSYEGMIWAPGTCKRQSWDIASARAGTQEETLSLSKTSLAENDLASTPPVLQMLRYGTL